MEVIYRFKQRLCYLLLKRHRTRQPCQVLIPRLLRAIYELQQVGLAQLVQLGQTLSSWKQEIVAMWRFTRNNAITEGFPYQDGSPSKAGVRISELSKLPIEG